MTDTRFQPGTGVRSVALAICKSRTCEGVSCCQWPANMGRTNCNAKNGAYDDAARAAIAVLSSDVAVAPVKPDAWRWRTRVEDNWTFSVIRLSLNDIGRTASTFQEEPLYTALPSEAIGREVVAQHDALVRALEEIAEPIQALQKMANDYGHQLDGAMAIDMANDPYYLRMLAHNALSRLNAHVDGEPIGREKESRT